jgi:H+-translocating NAD(P) transhydrogenase subunit beta
MGGGEAGLYTTAYLVAGVLFIRSLGGLSKQESARRGNRFGIVGMVLAILTTLSVWGTVTGVPPIGLALLVGAVAIGAVIGAVMARRVEMTGMPELVAMLHSFVGVAAVLVGISSYLAPTQHVKPGLELVIHLVEIGVGAR